jgi:hypothetical protein
MMRVGDTIVRNNRPEIVERIERLPTAMVPVWELKALYLGAKFSTDITVEDLDDARLATDADHAAAIAYAERFKQPELPL